MSMERDKFDTWNKSYFLWYLIDDETLFDVILPEILHIAMS